MTKEKGKWKRLRGSKFQIKELIIAREALHQAVQLVASAARSFSPKSEGDEFGSLMWSVDQEALISQTIQSDKKYFVALHIKKLTLSIYKKNGKKVDNFSLKNKTHKQAQDWLVNSLNEIGFNEKDISFELPYEIPEYAIAKEGKYQYRSKDAFRELSRLYHNAYIALTSINNKLNSTLEIKCWPHHFDIAFLMIKEVHSDPEKAKSIGVGLSPGDVHYNEPYFYITPWPYPKMDNNDLPELKGKGEWHTDNWVGAILRYSQIIKKGSAKGQFKRVMDFLLSGISQNETLLKE
ncbi:hypothetical protein QQ008_21815 [Fulvivirgaceae bacterium BMA10]|uniref:Uncharacterized protein n=1 Tax=Splendidivirga corallicola TaxID=3051826 RepID=A0ABT8KV54_9BACT|nr:hypothetical protein [Fulvivirgaceae bacterium BMA10]